MKNATILLLVLTLLSCGKISTEGNIVTRDVTVEDFVNLDLRGNFRVFFVRSDSTFINLETYKNIADNLKIKVKDKTLSIGEKRDTENVDFYNITIFSRLPLEKVALSDLVEMNISGEIKTDNFRLQLKKNAKFIGSVHSRRAELEMSEKSRANFSGMSRHVVAKISDTASLIAPYWVINTLKIQSADENYTEVNVKDSITGNIANTAHFVYYGDPVRNFKIEKTAKVENKELE